MKVILKQDVENVGRKGDLVNVAAGYRAEFSHPQETGDRSHALEHEDDRYRTAGPEEKSRAGAAFLSGSHREAQPGHASVSPAKPGEKDHIFGSVSATDIKEALDKLGFDIDKKKIVLDEPLKRLGNYAVPIKVYHDDKAEIKVAVVKEKRRKKRPAKKRNRRVLEESEAGPAAKRRRSPKGGDSWNSI